MFQIDLKNRRPIYEQVVDNFKRLVVSGRLKEGERVPSTRDMAKTLGINPNTVQKAYRELENRGYFYTVLGQGSFIAALKDDAKQKEISELYASVEKLISELRLRGEEAGEILAYVEHMILYKIMKPPSSHEMQEAEQFKEVSNG